MTNHHTATVQTVESTTRKPAASQWRPGFVVWLLKDEAVRKASDGANSVAFDTYVQALAAAQAITATAGLDCTVMRYSKAPDGWFTGHECARTFTRHQPAALAA